MFDAGRGLNEAFTAGMRHGWGMGESVARALEAAGRPLGALEVLQTAKSGAPGLGIATVYRTLKLLTDQGRIHPVTLDGETLYEASGKGAEAVARRPNEPPAHRLPAPSNATVSTNGIETLSVVRQTPSRVKTWTRPSPYSATTR